MACSYADHFAGLGRRFRICRGTSRIRGMITPGAVANAEIRVVVFVVISVNSISIGSRSDKLNLAVGFNPRDAELNTLLSRQRQLNVAPDSTVATRRDRVLHFTVG